MASDQEARRRFTIRAPHQGSNRHDGTGATTKPRLFRRLSFPNGRHAVATRRHSLRRTRTFCTAEDTDGDGRAALTPHEHHCLLRRINFQARVKGSRGLDGWLHGSSGPAVRRKGNESQTGREVGLEAGRGPFDIVQNGEIEPVSGISQMGAAVREDFDRGSGTDHSTLLCIIQCPISNLRRRNRK